MAARAEGDAQFLAQLASRQLLYLTRTWYSTEPFPFGQEIALLLYRDNLRLHRPY